jgi:hypothetical protein
MHRKALFALLIKLAFLALLATTKDSPNQWGAPVQGYRLRLVTDSDQYRVGEPINLHVILQNITQRELPVGHFAVFLSELNVYLPTGGHAPLTLWGRGLADSLTVYLGANPMMHLAPGESKTVDFAVVTRAFDMTLEGQYTIVVDRKLQSQFDPDASIDVFSNSIVIKLVAPESKPTTRPDN